MDCEKTAPKHNRFEAHTLCHAGDQAKQVSVAVGISYTEYYLNCAHMGMSAYTATSGTLRCGPLTARWQAQAPAWQISILGAWTDTGPDLDVFDCPAHVRRQQSPQKSAKI